MAGLPLDEYSVCVCFILKVLGVESVIDGVAG